MSTFLALSCAGQLAAFVGVLFSIIAVIIVVAMAFGPKRDSTLD